MGYSWPPYRQQVQDPNSGLPFDPNAVGVYSPSELDTQQPIMQSQQRLQDALNQQQQANQPGGIMNNPVFQAAIPTALTALSAIFPRHMAVAGPIGIAGYRSVMDANQMQNRQQQTTAADAAKQRLQDFLNQKQKYNIGHSGLPQDSADALSNLSDISMPDAAKGLVTETDKQRSEKEYQDAVNNPPKLGPGEMQIVKGPLGERRFEGPTTKPITLDQALMSEDPKLHAGAVQALKDKEKYGYHTPNIQIDDTTGQLWSITMGDNGQPVGRPVPMMGGGGSPVPSPQAAPTLSPQTKAVLGKAGLLSDVMDTMPGAQPQQDQQPPVPAPKPTGGPHFSKGGSQGISNEQAVQVAQNIHDYKDDPTMATLGRKAASQVEGAYATMFPGDNLADKKLEYTATKSALQSMNNETQMRLKQNVGRASHEIDLMQQLMDQWHAHAKDWGLKALNSVELAAYANGTGPASGLANNILGQTQVLVSELAKINAGTTSPTDQLIQHTQSLFSGAWNEETLNQVFPKLRQNVANQALALKSSGVSGFPETHYHQSDENLNQAGANDGSGGKTEAPVGTKYTINGKTRIKTSKGWKDIGN